VFDNEQFSLAFYCQIAHWERTISRTLAIGNLLQKFPTFDGCRPFIIVDTKVRQWSVPTTIPSPVSYVFRTHINIIFHSSLMFLKWYFLRNQDSVISTETRQRVRRSRVRILAEERDISVLRKTRNKSGVHPTSYAVGTGSLSRALSGRSVMLTTHRHLASKLRRSGAVPLIPPYALIRGQDNFNF